MGMIILTLVAIYSAGAHCRGRSLLVATLLVLATTVVTAIHDGSSQNVSGFLFFSFWICGPFLVGLVIRIRRERERLLEASATRRRAPRWPRSGRASRASCTTSSPTRSA